MPPKADTGASLQILTPAEPPSHQPLTNEQPLTCAGSGEAFPKALSLQPMGDRGLVRLLKSLCLCQDMLGAQIKGKRGPTSQGMCQSPAHGHKAK